ncbi:MAG TPA: DMT family transporter [Candidatus Hydrogenedens sp.]|nr:DMT family transporter [Candidatus Hydrogenedens sp.]HOK09172.1 DMT family transporter [Candidatus Hydrogenedens sp.]HOL19234.1 DMT family transporter [Candidatus Hydrogenedens sp.]HPP58939.1 DMT family transporter [Candidatus Hydrogenedens sp.]
MLAKHKAGIALSLAILGWSFSPIFIRYLQDAYDPFTQAGIRYFGAVLFLVPYCFAFYRDALLKAFANPIPTIVLSATNVIMQSAWTIGIYYSTASLGQILVKIQIPIVALFSFVVFSEERSLIKHPQFIIGSLFGILGSILLIYQPSGKEEFPYLYYAVGALFLSALLWGVYCVYGKYTVERTLHPIPMFGVISIYTTIGLLTLGYFFGDMGKAFHASYTTYGIALFSGLLPIAIAHSSFHYAQWHLGSAFCNTLLTLNPLITHFFALLLWKNEGLNSIQWIGTAILLVGCILVLFTKSDKNIQTLE